MADRSIIGIDIGGTKCAIGLYEEHSLALLTAEQIPTRRKRGFAAILDELLQRINAVKRTDTSALGIGVPGLVRRSDGTIVHLPNIPGGEGFPLRAFLEQRTGLRVVVGNDSQGFALAEAREGAGKGHRVVVGITMGTGVGGGIVVDGELFLGSDGYAGEIGHLILVPGEPPYETEDKRGDVEQFLSGSAMRRRCAAAERPEDLLAGDACAFLRPEIIRETAILCANLTHAFNPSIIVFGGGTGRALAPYLTAIQEEMTRWLMKGAALPSLAIRTLEDAATRGAAMLALLRL